MKEEKYLKCAYSKCFLGGKVLETEAITDKKKHYHWGCLKTKIDIEELRTLYIENIDKETSIPQLSKVLNDLIFKYNEDIEYLKFALNYYIKYKIAIKSPFALLYLRNNKIMKQKYKNAKGVFNC